MSAKWLVGSLALLACRAAAVDLNLTGSVYDSTGKGIVGAKVRLVRAGLSTRTGPEGAWSILAVVPPSQATFPDTIVFGEDPDAPFPERVALAGPERTGIVMIGARPQLLGRRRSIPSAGTGAAASRSMHDAAGAPGAAASGPVATSAVLPRTESAKPSAPPVAEVAEEPAHVPTRDSGMVALNWEHAVPSGAFVVEGSVRRESWVGGYGDYPLLFDSPVSWGYDLRLRYGLWEFGNGARSELSLEAARLQRNEDAGDADGFRQPLLRFRFGLLSALDLHFLLAPPLGSDRIAGPATQWTYGAGFGVSPRTGRFQFNLAATYSRSTMKDGTTRIPKVLDAHLEPQVALADWLGAYCAADFQLGVNQPLSEDGGAMHDSRVLWVEPGARLNLGRHFGLGLGAPFTVYGDDQVARWAVKATLRGAFGL